jgi:putative ABC transport system permease protein
MKKHEIRISLRRLLKERLYTLINIGGLALGIAAALLIFLYLLFETSYDRHNIDHARIYRVGTDLTIEGEHMQLALNSVPLGPLMKSQLPEITDFLRIFPAGYFFRNIIYRYEEKHFFEDGVFAVDSTVFEFFTYRFLEGSPGQALNEPFSMVMTESMAKRYFGDEPALGKMVLLDGAGSFRVSAIIEDTPINSHFQFAGLISMATMPHLNHLIGANFMRGATWQALEMTHGARLVWVYLKTAEGFDPDDFMENTWPGFYENHIATQAGFGGIDKSLLIFQPMADIHLKSKLPYEMTSATGAVTMMSPELIRIFILIAVFLLVLAAINYTNIAISRFSRRSKEVGVKKVMGASKGTLVQQFFIESVITTIVALLVALLLVEFLLPYVNNLLQVSLSANVFSNPQLLMLLLGVAVFVGLIAGGYPAVYLSSFSPLQALAHRAQPGRKSMTLKKGLIILQFAISVFMIAATLVVNSQLRFINSKDLGFDREHTLIVELQDNASRQGAETLKNTLSQSPMIEKAAVSNYFPSILTMFNGLYVETTTGHASFSANVVQVSPDFLDFMEMEMLEGRFFDRNYQTDPREAVVVNEAAVRYFGWENALGKEVTSGFVWPDGTSSENRKVIGVVRDFHYASLVNPIEPMVFYPMQGAGNYLLAKVRGDRFQEGIRTLEETWAAYAPNQPLEYNVLDQVIASMYDSQRVLGVFFAAFAWLCIVIAFLGLYGLSAFSAEQRTREIGIRKVLGARFADVLAILGKEFLWLILIAMAIAASLAWYLMNRWLEGFAYHIDLHIWPMLIAGLAATGIALLAVGIHAWKASQMNATESLKYE